VLLITILFYIFSFVHIYSYSANMGKVFRLIGKLFKLWKLLFCLSCSCIDIVRRVSGHASRRVPFTQLTRARVVLSFFLLIFSSGAWLPELPPRFFCSWRFNCLLIYFLVVVWFLWLFSCENVILQLLIYYTIYIRLNKLILIRW